MWPPYVLHYSAPGLYSTDCCRSVFPHDDDDDDSDDDFSDDEELQSPIDEVDPFVFFVDSIKGKLKNVQVHQCHRHCSLCYLTSHLTK